MSHYVLVDPATDAILAISPTPYDAPRPQGAGAPIIPKGAETHVMETRPDGFCLFDRKNKRLIADDARNLAERRRALNEKKAALDAAVADVTAQIAALPKGS